MKPKSSFQVAAPFLKAAPDFRPRWEAFVRSLENQEEVSMHTYTAMGELAQFIVESYEADQTAAFPDIFCIVEQYLETGDDELANLVQVGLFESLQNIASHRPFGFKVFEQWLGPRALLLWRRADEAMTIVAKAAARARRRWWQFWKRRGAFDPEKALRELENPKLREIIESDYRRLK